MAKTIPLHLKDNSFNDAIAEQVGRGNVNVALDVLRDYNGRILKDLLKMEALKRETQLVAVHDQKQPLFTFGAWTNGYNDQSGAYNICTGNLMGWVCLSDKKGNSVRLNITSRFDGDVPKNEEKKGASSKKSGNGKDDYGKQYFLYYMLARVCRVNPLSAIDVNRRGGGERLVAVLLFISFLGKAEPYGVMRAYVKLRKNDLNVKGRIDVSRHIKLNYPVGGRIAYVHRKLTADIPINHLIRHAAEMICKRYSNLLAGNPAAKSFLEQLRMATPSWQSGTVSDFARTEANRVVTHPYHAEQYEPLRKMALKILTDEGIDLYGKDSKDTASGIVFDGSWLWENYLWDVLRRSGIEGFVHSDNSEKKNPVYPLMDKESQKVWDAVKWYPDFRVSDHGGRCTTVLDAKYKPLNERLEDGQYLSDDIHEVLSYMYALGARKGFLLYPYKNEEDQLPVSFELRGIGGDFHFVGMKIPQSASCDNFPQFCKKMEDAEKLFVGKLAKLLAVAES